MFTKKVFLAAALSLICLPFGALAENLRGAGKLIVAGGGVSSSSNEIWTLMLKERLSDRPIGIISTASPDPEERSARTANSINEQFGEGSAVAIPVGENNDHARNPETVELIRNSGGFYFTGGLQTRTIRALLEEDGAKTPALEAIWEVYRQGGVIGGSSAGAAIMSDPMISGGGSSGALLRGATPHGLPNSERGIGYLAGLGFHPGVLYCQHHLERGRFGRLLAALVSDDLDYTVGVGVAEDTALLVDHAANTGTVVGSKGVLYVDTKGLRRNDEGGFAGVRLHYLDRGDTIHFPSGRIRPAAGKSVVRSGSDSLEKEVEDAWARDAVWHLLQDLAQSGRTASVTARDENFDIVFERTRQTRVWRQRNEAEDARPTWTVSNIHVSVNPRQTAGD